MNSKIRNKKSFSGLLLNYITYMGDLVNPGYDKNIGRKEFIKEEQFVMFLVRKDCMKTVNDSSLQEIHRTKNLISYCSGHLLIDCTTSLSLSHLPLCVCLVAQSCLTLCDPMVYNLLGSSVHGARILEWDAMCSSRGSSQPRD